MKYSFSSLGIRLFLFLCLLGNLSALHSQPIMETYNDLPAYQEGTFVLSLSPDVTLLTGSLPTGITSLDQELARYGVYHLEAAIPHLKGSGLPESETLERVYYAQYDHPMSPPEVATIFARDPHVTYAEPRYHFFPTAIPDDSAYSSMPEFGRIQAEMAWDFAKGENGNVVIAIIDGGTDWNHEDLLANVWTNPNEIAGNGIDDDANGYADDVHGWNFVTNSPDPTGQASTPNIARHGTHVAGTAAGVTHNAIGMSSLSWNCKFMPINIANPNVDDLWSYFFEGIIYAAANGADVISVSGGSPFYTEFGREAVAFAHANGALVVAAAGNDDQNIDLAPFYPANFDHVLSVGAVSGGDDIKADFSNYGISVDVFAPGTAIYSTTPDDQYDFLQGTSMATPMVSALAGLVKTYLPNLSPDQLAERIRVTCDPIGGFNPQITNQLGKGRINALRALLQPAAAVRISEATFTENGNDGVIHAGDTLDLLFDMVNYLDDVSGLSLTLRDVDPHTTLLQSTATIPQLLTDQHTAVSFRVVVDSLITSGYRLPFVLEITDGGTYQDLDFVAFEAIPIQVRTHTTDQIAISITNEGNIGWLDTVGTAGQGYVYNGNNVLFEAGLMLGTSVDQVSDCIRGANPGVQDQDFQALSPLIITSTGVSGFEEEGNVSLNDANAPLPTGLNVDMLSLVGFSLFPGLDEGLILTYVVSNPTQTQIDSIYLGLYADANLNSDKNDFVRFDQSRKMGVIENAATAPTQLMAIKLLNPEFGVSFDGLDNDATIDDGFTDIEKWNALRGINPVDNLNDQDVSMILSVGPLSLEPLESDTLGFVIMASESRSDLQSQAATYSFLWNLFNPITGIESETQTQGISGSAAFPNPFQDKTVISYQLDQPTRTDIRVYTSTGQLVRNWRTNKQSAGPHQLTWDGRDNQGRLLPGGTYQLVVFTEFGILSQSLIYHP